MQPDCHWLTPDYPPFSDIVLLGLADAVDEFAFDAPRIVDMDDDVPETDTETSDATQWLGSELVWVL